MATLERPATDNYFAFYGLTPAFAIDADVLKKLYLEKSRQYHPDFFNDDPVAQNVAIEVTAFNNKAFKVLNNPVDRIKYLVQINSDKEDNKTLSQDFLMDMLDLNEQIDELSFAEDKEPLRATLTTAIDEQHQQLMAILIQLVEKNEWGAAKDELLKLAYLERLKVRI
jgi:molecular chaperone HscB